MKIAEQMTAELKTLPPDDLMRVHQVIMTLKSTPSGPNRPRNLSASRRVRAVLQSCPGAWSKDLMINREDRV